MTDSAHSYVILTATLSTVIASWHGIYVYKYRNEAKVPCRACLSDYIMSPQS
jgi:hypothetical protein